MQAAFNAAVAPTCAKPGFIIGIPKCATTAQNILSAVVKGTQAGQANLSITGVKVIGAGTDVAFSSQGGTYNMAAAQTATPKITPKTTVAQPTSTPAQQVATSTPQPTSANNLPANVGAAAVANSGASQWFSWLLIIVVILIVIYAIYYFATKRKKK